MSDGSIKIRIGASADRSIDATFTTIEKRAQKARDTIAKMFGAGGSGRGVQQIQTDAEKAFAGVEKASDKAAKAQVRAQERASKDIERQLQQQTRAAEREVQKQSRAHEREAANQARTVDRFATRTSHRAVKFLFPNPTGLIGGAHRIAGDLMRGAGIDTSISGSVSRSVSLQKQAIQLSNQGFMPTEGGANAKRVGAGTLEAEARQIGASRAMDPNEVLAAMTKFVDLTGDLDGARQNMGQLADLAGASGTDLVAMADAAAQVQAQLKEAGLPADRLGAVMRVVAGQGKVGAIELKDFAKQISAIAAVAPRFAGSVDDNLTELTALAEISRRKGGSKSPAMAATSIGRFADIFKTPARVKALTAAGVTDLYDDHHHLKDSPFRLAKKILAATGGDELKIQKILGGVMPGRALSGLTATFNQAGGGKAGMAAVDELLGRFGKGSALSKEQVAQNNAERLKSDAAKAQQFQNELDKIVSVTARDLVPAMEALAPVALNAAQALGGLVKFAADNPVSAIVLAIAAAVARAGIESAFRAAIESALKRAAGTGGPGGGGGGGGGGLGIGGQAFRVLGGAAGGALLGAGIGELGGDARGGGLVGGSIGALAQGGTMGAGLGAALGVGAAVDQAIKLKNESGGWDFWNADKNLDEQAKAKATAEGRKFISGPSGALTPEQYDKQMAVAKRHGMLDPVEVGNATGTAMATALGTRTLNVRVVNAADIAKGPTAPKVSPAGRAPAPGG